MKRVVAVAMVVACGAADERNHAPDSGYGQNARVPGRGCSTYCSRATDCAIQLCNEDEMTSKYDTQRAWLEIQCNETCDEAAVAEISDEQWSCIFTDSCRMVLQDNSCDAEGSYRCP